MNGSGFYGGRSQGRSGFANKGYRGDDFYSMRGHSSASEQSRGPLLGRGDYRVESLSADLDRLRGLGASLDQGYSDNYWSRLGGGDYRSQQNQGFYGSSQYRTGMNDQGRSANKYDQYNRRSFADSQSDYRDQRGYSAMSAMDQSFTNRMDRDECVLGYFCIHNMRKGKSGLFLISYLNSLMRTRLFYHGPPVVFSARINDSTLEVVFPSVELLRAVVEKLSPITVKGNIVVYVTHKPSFPLLLAKSRLAPQRPVLPPPRRLVVSALPASRQPPPASAASRKPAPRSKGGNSKLKLPRLRGVFPGGVQPRHLVLLVDEAAAHVSVALLAASGAALIQDRAMDTAAMIRAIQDHQVAEASADDSLYVVVPSLALMLSGLDLVPDLEDVISGAGSTAAAAVKDKQLSLLQEALADFADVIAPVDMQVLARANPARAADGGGAVATDGGENRPLALLFLRALLHASLVLRAAVRADTCNSEVVFCGYPAHHMMGERASAALERVVSPSLARRAPAAVLTAVIAYNDFAANTWQLGGFKLSSLSVNLTTPHVIATSKTGGGKELILSPCSDLLTVATPDQAWSGAAAVVTASRDGMVPLAALAGVLWLQPDCVAAVQTGFSSVVLAAVQKVANFHQNKGCLLPWSPVPGAPTEGKQDLPDTVKLSVHEGIYTANTGEGQAPAPPYYCTECRLSLPSVAAADSHAYTRRHANRVRRLLQQRARDGGAKRSPLTGTAPPAVTVPVHTDYLEKLVSFKMLSQLSSSPSRYACLVCGTGRSNTAMSGPELRFHLHQYRHRLALATMLGVSSHRALVNQHENWQLVKELLRHPPLDVVVVADASLGPLLEGLTRNSKVRLSLVPSLLQSPVAGAVAAVQGADPRPTLWLVVAGVDLLKHSGGEADHSTPEALDKLVSPVSTVQASLRLQLPSHQLVVVAPLLPLMLLPAPPPPHLSPHLHVLAAPAPRLPALTALYAALSGRCLALHRATAAHANVPPVVVPPSPAATPATSLWHAAMQPYLAAATSACLPAPWLRQYPSTDGGADAGTLALVEELELQDRVQRVVLVVGAGVGVVGAGRAAGDPRSGAKSSAAATNAPKTLTLLHRDLSYDEADVQWAATQAPALTCEDGGHVAWYVHCPVPTLALHTVDNPWCKAQRCTQPLPCYAAPTEEDGEDPRLRAATFLTRLQSRLPPGHVVCPLPAFPCTVVCGDSAPLAHSAMHALAHDAPNACFSQDSCEVLKPPLERMRDAWAHLLLSTPAGLHYAPPPPVDALAQAQVMPLLDAVTTVRELLGAQAQRWLAAVNALLGNHCGRYRVSFTPAVCAQLGLNASSFSGGDSEAPGKTDDALQTTEL